MPGAHQPCMSRLASVTPQPSGRRATHFRRTMQPVPLRCMAAEGTPAGGGTGSPPLPPPQDPLPQKTVLQRLGQSFNAGGIAFFARVALTDRSLAVPHLSVSDLRCVRWAALREAGFEGCVFDKDNTLTEPYALELHPHAVAALAECRREFGGRLALYSNSAGLEQFDPEGEEAQALEDALGVPVMRHRQKKPAGGPEDLEQHFGCGADKLIMIGDRFLTDVVFGNRLGMLTIRPEPYTSAGEPKAVRAARKIEEAFVWRCQRAGVLPPAHALVAGAEQLATFLALEAREDAAP